MNDYVLTDTRLFTAVDDTVCENASLWIHGGHIAYAGEAQGLPADAQNAPQLNLNGRFVMPGMTESHAHLSFSDSNPFSVAATSIESSTITAVRNARVMLASGFTSAISFGSNFGIDVALRDAIRRGEVLGPRLLAAGQDLGATASNVDSGGGLSQIADGPWALRQAVREQRKRQVDVVKVFIDGEAINPVNPPGELAFTDEELNAVVDEAHRRQLRVACHSRSAAAVKQAVRAGVDFIGHANFVDDEAVEMLAEVRDRVFVGPGVAWETGYLEHCESLGVPRQAVIDQGYAAQVEATVVAVEKMRAAGIRLLVGGDYGISIAPHGTYAKDLEQFVSLFGMSPAEALLCATRSGGEAADPTGKTGTLTAGSHADFLIVDGDPLTDITVLQDHARFQVAKAGVLYEDLINASPWQARQPATDSCA